MLTDRRFLARNARRSRTQSALASSCLRYILRAVCSGFSDEKKLSIVALSQTLPIGSSSRRRRDRPSAAGTARRCTGCHDPNGAAVILPAAIKSRPGLCAKTFSNSFLTSSDDRRQITSRAFARWTKQFAVRMLSTGMVARKPRGTTTCDEVRSARHGRYPITIILPVKHYVPRHLKAAVQSVLDQSSGDWRRCW